MRRFGPALSLTLLLTPSAAAQVDVRGTALQPGGGLAIEGARATLLADGVLPVAEAVADEAGRFVLEAPPGVYDLRVRAEGRLTETVADLSLVEGRAAEPSVELVPVEAALRARGLDPEWFADRDRDFVPDRFERELRGDEELADSDEDGLTDGTAEWLGVGTRADRWRPELTGFPWTGELERVPGVASAPLPLRFARLPGASGYLLELLDEEGEVVVSEPFDFEDRELVVGEGVLARWSPPAGLAEGAHRLRLSGYARDLDHPIGSEFETALELVSEPEIGPLELTEGAALQGRVVATELRVAGDVVITVPAGGWLELVALGDVVIEEGARVLGEPGASISIRAGRDVLVYGEVEAGAGLHGGQRAGRERGLGGPGGDLSLCCGRGVVVGARGRLRSGDGGPGEAGFAGGTGGALIVLCQELLVADRPGVLHVGAGGDGGDGAPPGVGGHAGDVWLSRWDLRGDGFVDLGEPDYPLQGGIAGRPGAALSGVDGSGLDRHTGDLPQGGWGWLRGGDGLPAVAIGGGGSGSQRGGAATAWGGSGGGVSRIGLARGSFGLTFGFLSRAGDGGGAQASGGGGGDGGGFGRSGDGGDAAAAGGTGGEGLRLRVALPSAGGHGGSAGAVGGTGQQGRDRCGPEFPPPGGPGSPGGSAEAQGGSGGVGNTRNGAGGFASAAAGDGGDGGGGRPGGRGGSGGDATARGGAGSPPGTQPGHAWRRRRQGPRLLMGQNR